MEINADTTYEKYDIACEQLAYNMGGSETWTYMAVYECIPESGNTCPGAAPVYIANDDGTDS